MGAVEDKLFGITYWAFTFTFLFNWFNNNRSASRFKIFLTIVFWCIARDVAKHSGNGVAGD